QPDPARRWPSMAALLTALTPDHRRRTSLRVATVAATLASGAVGLAWLATPDAAAEIAAEREHNARALETAAASADAARLMAARGALAEDPAAAVAGLASVEGDDPATRARAQFVSSVAETRGL